MGGKRKNGAAAPEAAGGKKPKAKASAAAPLEEHVNKVVAWFRSRVLDAGGPDQYLAQVYDTQDKLTGFAQWLEESFPPAPECLYATSLDIAGTLQLRPWMLSFRADYGLAGYVEPEVAEMLVQLILSETFRTDSALAGVERLAVCSPPEAYLEAPATKLPELRSGLLAPFSVAFVKGWRRSVCALICLQGLRELDLLGALTAVDKAAFGTIHATVNAFQDARAQVAANRGITMGSANTRRMPNAFNFLRQIAVVQKSGGGTAQDHFDEWTSATKVAKAYGIGKAESGAVASLMSKTPTAVVEKLQHATRRRGMFVTHDCIAKGLFELGFTSGIGAVSAWQQELTNLDDLELVNLFTQRMINDYDSQLTKKQLSYKESLARHQACGCFVYYMKKLKGVAPVSEFESCREALVGQFQLQYLDGDLLHHLETAVPPGNLEDVSAFRSHYASFQKKQTAAAELRQAELAKRVAEATLAQLEAKIETDMCELEKVMPTPEQEKIDARKDIKYVEDRQARGNTWTREWMQKHCRLSIVGDDFEGAMQDMTQYFAEFQGAPGRMLVLFCLDSTIWPANSARMHAAVQHMSTGVSLSQHNACLVLWPMMQSQTTWNALCRHRRALEDALIKQNVDSSHNVTLVFDKEPAARGTDKRKSAQAANLVVSNNFSDCTLLDAECVNTGTLPGLPLIRVSDMLGYDDDARPGGAARVEQKGVAWHKALLEGLLSGLQVTDGDRVIVVDVLPNRHAEMARACAKRFFENVRPQALYMGFLSSEQKDVEAAITSTVWNHWDALPDSPPKQRPSPELAAPQNLQILSWAGGPVWPETIWKHFQPDSPEYQALQNKHKLFKEKFPSAVVLPAGGSESTTAVRRATGRPDYTIDGGAAPLDITRVVDTEKKTEAEFGAVTRLASATTKNNIHVVIAKDDSIWIGHRLDQATTLSSCELFGFNTGVFEEKVYQGPDAKMIPFRLDSDLTLVSYKKTVMGVCELLHQAVTRHGIGEVAITDHALEGKVTSGENGAEGTAVPYRYNLTPNAKLHCFKPNPLGERTDMKTVTMGAVFCDQLHKIQNMTTKKIGLVWEVDLQSSVPAALVPLKPKIYLTCQLHMEPGYWYRVM